MVQKEPAAITIKAYWVVRSFETALNKVTNFPGENKREVVLGKGNIFY